MAKKSPTQIWIEYVFVRIVFGVLGILPRGAAVRVGTALAAMAGKFLGGMRRTATTNLALAFPEMDERERARLVTASLRNLGRILGDLSQFPKSTRESITALVEDCTDPALRARLKEVKASGRGAILMSPHLGNWEIAVLWYSIAVEPVSFLARPLDNPMIEDFSVAVRTRFGNRPINKRNSAAAAIALLRKGESLGLLPDVNAHPKEGVFVPFFGVQACTLSGPALIALRTNSILVPVCCVWDEMAGKYKFHTDEIIEPVNTGDRANDVEATTALYTAVIERYIRQYPDQWIWSHKRWKTRPEGEPGIY